jgi:hypothetical protein
MKLERIKNEQLELGNIVYSEYTEQYYIVSCLPRIIKEDVSKFALVRMDGQGYFYLSDTIEEIINKMNMDGGETEAYKVLEYHLTL